MNAQPKTEESSGEELKKISFPWGIPGLEYDEFILTAAGEESPFYFLESVREPGIGLIVTNPFEAFSGYEFDLEEEIVSQLKIKEESQVAVFCTVNISRGFEAATANLLAPIVVNTKDLLGKQVVLNEKKYSVRTPLVIIKEEKGR
ncbi:MAG: flagellar assembly protein FliW [Firmicutes bacterium]|nr:flagellar assembly protein FliW [Bacillota bacterium]